MEINYSVQQLLLAHESARVSERMNETVKPIKLRLVLSHFPAPNELSLAFFHACLPPTTCSLLVFCLQLKVLFNVAPKKRERERSAIRAELNANNTITN